MFFFFLVLVCFLDFFLGTFTTLGLHDDKKRGHAGSRVQVLKLWVEI